MHLTGNALLMSPRRRGKFDRWIWEWENLEKAEEYSLLPKSALSLGGQGREKLVWALNSPT